MRELRFGASMKLLRAVLIVAFLVVPQSALSQVGPSEFFQPEAGAVGGSTLALFSATALSRGLFSLPSPFELPSEEGAILWNIFPNYTPDSGISEMEWAGKHHCR